MWDCVLQHFSFFPVRVTDLDLTVMKVGRNQIHSLGKLIHFLAARRGLQTKSLCHAEKHATNNREEKRIAKVRISGARGKVRGR
jgi:hypothetical protein